MILRDAIAVSLLEGRLSLSKPRPLPSKDHNEPGRVSMKFGSTIIKHKRQPAYRSHKRSQATCASKQRRKALHPSTVQENPSMPRALFDRRVHSDYRRARSRRPLPRCLDCKSIASLRSSLRRVLESRYAELFQLAVCWLLRNFRATHRAAYPDWKQATSPGLDVNVAGRVLAPIRQRSRYCTIRSGPRESPRHPAWRSSDERKSDNFIQPHRSTTPYDQTTSVGPSTIATSFIQSGGSGCCL